jgi:hypothetical protein
MKKRNVRGRNRDHNDECWIARSRKYVMSIIARFTISLHDALRSRCVFAIEQLTSNPVVRRQIGSIGIRGGSARRDHKAEFKVNAGETHPIEAYRDTYLPC